MVEKIFENDKGNKLKLFPKLIIVLFLFFIICIVSEVLNHYNIIVVQKLGKQSL